jgi:hypothetical protein
VCHNNGFQIVSEMLRKGERDGKESTGIDRIKKKGGGPQG